MSRAGMSSIEELTAIHYKTVERIMLAQLYAQCVESAAAAFSATVPRPIGAKDTEYSTEIVLESAKTIYDTALDVARKSPKS